MCVPVFYLSGVSDYFLKPAQPSVAMVEVGREGYCAVYPEPGSEILYTVCLVPTSDAETCPLIAYNASNCCVCGSPDCEHALGRGVNTSVGLTADPNWWPGVYSCVVFSQSALTFDCFVQRVSSEVTSLRQFTGSISYWPTSASEANLKMIIPLPLGVLLFVCIVVICVLSVRLCHEKRVRRSAESTSGQVDVQGGGGGGTGNGVGGFTFVCMYVHLSVVVCACVHARMCVCACVCVAIPHLSHLMGLASHR